MATTKATHILVVLHLSQIPDDFNLKSVRRDISRIESQLRVVQTMITFPPVPIWLACRPATRSLCPTADVAPRTLA